METTTTRTAIRRLAGFFLIAFLALSLALPYWQLARADLLARPDNPRPAEAQRRVQRGRILDRAGRELAHSDRLATGETRRVYAYPPLVHVVGYSSARYQQTGIEAAENDALQGTAGATPQETFLKRLLHRPTVGGDVTLTIDLEWQKVADAALGNAAGAIVLLDARSGAILALASHPTYDPNRLEEAFERLKDDPARPLLNRATQGLYPPGSTFKTITLVAALEQRIVDPTTGFTYTLRPADSQHKVAWHKNDYVECANHGHLATFDLAGAYAVSCNVAFSELGLKLGPATYELYARRFGLGQRPPLEIAAIASQLYHTPDYFTGQERFYALASTAFGQGEIAVTPLQMALIAASIANDGQMPAPYLVQEVRDPAGNLLRRATPRTWQVATSAFVAGQAREIMIYSVNNGWASQAKIKGVNVGGKTGTAETGDPSRPPHSWFIGFVEVPGGPARYAIAVIKEFTGYGSDEAAPAARRVFEAILNK